MTMPDETMRAELAPCPFCGGTDIAVKVRKTTMVECKSCGAVMFDYHDGMQRDAIAAWNRRASAAPGGAPVVNQSLTTAASGGEQVAPPFTLYTISDGGYAERWIARKDSRGLIEPIDGPWRVTEAEARAAISESEGSSNGRSSGFRLRGLGARQ